MNKLQYLAHQDGCTIKIDGVGLTYYFGGGTIEEQIFRHKTSHTKEYNRHLSENTEAIKEAFRLAYIQVRVRPVIEFCKKHGFDLKAILNEIDSEKIFFL